MHTYKAKEKPGLSRLVGLAVAGATLLAGMVVLPVTQASALNETEDEFESGAVDDSKEPKLTVTKYLSTSQGSAPTGSITDKPAAGTATPAKDIVFNVREVKPASGTVASIDPNDSASYTFVTDGIYAAGMTDGQGVISNWKKAAAGTGALTGTDQPFPSGIHYYIMTENISQSPAFKAGGYLDSNKYTTSAPSFFGLPYRYVDSTNNKSGYIYHLHIYPKNVSNSTLNKSVTAIKDENGNDVQIAQAGDKITYKVTQKIFNSADHKLKDGKLDVAELQGNYQDIIIVDRMGTSLKLDDKSIAARLTWSKGATVKVLGRNTDFKVEGPRDTKFKRLVNSDYLFKDDTNSAVKYTAFEFFADNASVQSIKDEVAAAGDKADSELYVEVTYTATVTADGDSEANGGVTNAVQSDFRDNETDKPGDPPSGGTTTASGTVAFGKLEKTGAKTNAGLAGAVFRLADPAEPTKYLATDGNYHNDGDTSVTFFTATSNYQGAVVFTGLPIVDRTKNVGVEGNWAVVEYKAPAGGYEVARNPFSKVVYGSDVVGKTPEQIVQSHGKNVPIQPNYDLLNFGRWDVATDKVTTPIKFNGQNVAKYLMNYKSSDPDRPIGLPLTGGRGIVLLLVAGIVIMGGALYLRSRRNATRA